MGRVTRQRVPLERVLKHSLAKKFLKSGYDKEILHHQMQDPMMKDINYEEMSEKGLRIFLHGLLERGGEWENIRKEAEHAQQKKLSTGRQIETGDNRITLITDDEFTELKVILHKPMPEQGNLTEGEIRKLLLKEGVIYGVKKEYIIRLAEKPVYEKRFKLAVGKKPRTGKDGILKCYFNMEFSPVPKIKEDGTVDYKELDFAENVKRGALLCEVIPPEKGRDGIMLNGKAIEGQTGQAVTAKAGKNTFWSADRTKLYATRTGSPYIENDVIEVREVLTVKNVDASTGNIDFAGDVKILEDVEGAFTVEATGDIIVGGIVDGRLYAGGNVVLHNGVKGGGKSYIEAGKDICAEFFENANVLCRGNIVADAILNSNVVCWNNISVFGRNGKIIGGKITAGGKIMADQIGSESNTPTALTIEVAEGEFQHNLRIQKEIEAAEYMIKQIGLILEHGETDSDVSAQITILRLVYAVLCLEKQISEWKKEIENTGKRNSIKRSIHVKEILDSNVSIKIEGVFLRNTSTKVGETTMRVFNGRIVGVSGRGGLDRYEEHF